MRYKFRNRNIILENTKQLYMYAFKIYGHDWNCKIFIKDSTANILMKFSDLHFQNIEKLA